MQLLPLARLLRIPNVFTAFADIALGLCVVLGLTSPLIDSDFILRSALLFLTSGCLYCAGMVWNDYFDLEEDRKERPFRPLPSGKIQLKTAMLIGIALMIAGLGCAIGSGFEGEDWHATATVIAGILVVAILLYDIWLKHTPMGPIAMAFCRFLNVLLGLSLAWDAIPSPTRIHLALTIATYIVGVTWFARTEEKRSDPQVLRYAGIIIGVALAIGLALGVRVEPDTASRLFPYLLIAFAFYIGVKIVAAIEKPTADRVQGAVKRCILGLILFDAILATVFVGIWGLFIVLLLPPAMIIGKWVYST